MYNAMRQEAVLLLATPLLLLKCYRDSKDFMV